MAYDKGLAVRCDERCPQYTNDDALIQVGGGVCQYTNQRTYLGTICEPWADEIVSQIGAERRRTQDAIWMKDLHPKRPA